MYEHQWCKLSLFFFNLLRLFNFDSNPNVYWFTPFRVSSSWTRQFFWRAKKTDLRNWITESSLDQPASRRTQIIDVKRRGRKRRYRCGLSGPGRGAVPVPADDTFGKKKTLSAMLLRFLSIAAVGKLFAAFATFFLILFPSPNTKNSPFLAS